MFSGKFADVAEPFESSLIFLETFSVYYQDIIDNDYINSLHKPPRFIGMRIEKILPLPSDHDTLI